MWQIAGALVDPADASAGAGERLGRPWIRNPHCSRRPWDRLWHGARFHTDRTMIDGFVVRDLERHGLPDAGRR